MIYPKSLESKIGAFGVDLEDVVGCGYHSFGNVEKLTIVDRRETYQACARSWKRRPDVGSVPAYPDLCKRDAEAMTQRV